MSKYAEVRSPKNSLRTVGLLCRCLLSIFLIAVAGCSYAPKHEVPAKPAYIQAGIQVGDTVEITTVDGRRIEFVVAAVEGHALVGESERIEFGEIETLVKRSWTEPTHPCGGSEPVGCSVPLVVTALSTDLENQFEKFHPSCVQHDFCYRHGYATYGMSREQCDQEFYDDMKDRCADGGLLNVLDPEGSGTCRFAAKQMYSAVRRYGKDAYLAGEGTPCEYR